MFQVISAWFIALSVVTATAQNTADSIARQYQRALGNAERLAQLKRWSLVGKMVSPDGSWKRSFRAWFEGTKARTELVVQPGIIARSWTDGMRGWSIQPWTQSLTPQPMNQMSVRRMSVLASLWRNDLLAPQAGVKLEYLGLEELDGSDCHKLRARHSDGSVWTYWIDPDASLLVKLRVEARVSGEQFEWEATFGNYRNVEGVLMPMMLDTTSGLMIIEQYEFNPSLSPTLFSPPAQ
ncbi:MAG: outer membrane lipoprotein-sorting protein [Chlorobi bacterium]|nr:outer membrane lipoprotein-sorting protein [Chlorobiota bacterium]